MADDSRSSRQTSDAGATAGTGRLRLQEGDAGGRAGGAAPDLEPDGQGGARTDERPERYSGTYYTGDAEVSDLARYLRILYRRRWPAATAFLIVSILLILRSYRTTPVYEARVRVLVETERLNLVKIEDVVVESQTTETQVAILQSRWLARKTLESRGLLGRPGGATGRLAGGDAGATLWSRVAGTVGDWLGWRSGRSLPSRDGEPPERELEVQQISAFLQNLTVTPSKGVIDIKFRSADPVQAAQMANAHAQAYIEQNLELRFAAIKEVTDWLAARLAEQRQRVNAAEQALQRFREQHGLGVADEADAPLRARLDELGAALTRATAARLEKESLYNKIQALRGDLDSLVRLPPVAADPVVQQLRLELGRLVEQRAQFAEKLQERHPDMVKLRAAIQAVQEKLRGETDRVAETVRNDLASARAAEAGLQQVLEEQKRDAIAQNRRNVEAGILEREVESARQIYDMLLQRARETSIAKEIKPTEVRILDHAEVPRRPVLPNRSRDMTRALLAGLGVALALVFGFERLDNRLKQPDDIRAYLGLPVLGVIPEVHRRRDDQPVLLTNGLPPPFLEAVRSLRTNVLFSFAEEGLKTVLVTSVGPEEGKTVVATNLAVALAQAGERVLLVDADLRRPMVHTLFGRDRQPGLSNLLVGNAKAADVTHRTSFPHLWVLPAGYVPPNPPELLGSARFKKLLEALAEHFQWVILDSPPVLPVTDACVLAHLAHGVLLVVGADRASRPAARRAVEQLETARGHLVGAILARVELERHAYYYSAYYSRKYQRYYGGSSRT